MSMHCGFINQLGYMFALLILSVSAVFAESDMIADYQLRVLFHPSESHLNRESQGLVYIYEGMTDKMVSKAMDKQPERIKSMMFINTKITDENGALLRDPDTGAVLQEDDDC